VSYAGDRLKKNPGLKHCNLVALMFRFAKSMMANRFVFLPYYMQTEKINWKVDGMTCANCALSINRALEKEGLSNISVNVITGDVSFDTVDSNGTVTKAQKRVESLGYAVSGANAPAVAKKKPLFGLSKYMLYFWISLPFTAVLMLHMIPGLHLHWLMNPFVQLGLALPVYIIGMNYFGVSAIKSIRSGIPNMNVLIALGATSAFLYSIWGMFQPNPEDFMFFETAASIITIVFLGYYLEDVSVARTQKSIKELTREHVVMAHMIAYDADGHENVFAVESKSLKVGDLVLIKTGDQVPADCKILSGEAEVNEALLTGESLPVIKKQGDIVVGGSVVSNGNLKAYVTAVGADTVLSSIVAMMKKAQTEKPPVQQLADRISAVFIPLVLIIATGTLLVNHFVFDINFQGSLMRAVAVLVIACPCAMGLATPAAIAVGLGRAAKNGILFTDVKRMELFKDVQRMVFDKTGTLTTGKFQISNFGLQNMQVAGNENEQAEDQFKKLVYSLEKYSGHPIAKSISAAWKRKDVVRWDKIEEVKGLGMRAADREGNKYFIGASAGVKGTFPQGHNLYVTKNEHLIGWIDIADEIRPEAKELIDFCKSKGIETVILSGDTEAKCREVAQAIGIDTIVAGQSPEQKLALLEKWSAEKPTVMVGDGINDAPALAKATISVSLGEASQLAIQSASVVLTSGGLSKLPKAMLLGKHTYGTVKSNLFWAFSYNIVAIPIAAMGMLHPTMAALIMGGSDVVLALNSLWLGVRKLK
jgi:P-type Cu+ transporter